MDNNNSTNFSYPGSPAAAVVAPQNNTQSTQFANVAPPVTPAGFDQDAQAPTLADILSNEQGQTDPGGLDAKTQIPLIGDPITGSTATDFAADKNMNSMGTSDTSPVTDNNLGDVAPAKSALESLAEKLNAFKSSLVEETPDEAPVPQTEATTDLPTTWPTDTNVTAPAAPNFAAEPIIPSVIESTPTDSLMPVDVNVPTESISNFDLGTPIPDGVAPVLQSDAFNSDVQNSTATITEPVVNNQFPSYDPAQNVNPVMYVESPAPAVNADGLAPVVSSDVATLSDLKPEPFAAPAPIVADVPAPAPTPVVNAPAVLMPSTTTVVETDEYPYTIYQLLDIVIERNASDLHITVGYPASVRVDGSLIPVTDVKVTQPIAEKLLGEILPEAKKELLEVNREVDLAYSHGDLARFRINAFYQQQTLSAAFRLIPTRIKTIDELQLPQIYHQLTKLRQGFVLVTGPTGSGKSTTLASIIQEVNMTRSDHVITIEDPIEYIFPKSKAMINQRELHEDTHSWDIAMKSALRQDPDVVLVGEMRDYETIAAAITLAETGHLVFATLHTNSCAQTIDRIIDVFPEHQQSQVRSQLSNVLEAVIAQRLIPLDKGGRKAVSEIMIATSAVRNLIREGKTHQLDNVIRTSADIGMISLEHSLVKIVREGLITIDRAQEYAVRPEEVVRLLKG